MQVAASKKFNNLRITADGQERASVLTTKLSTLWVATGTRCNLACENCYIESSPTNDRLTYITTNELSTYLAEIEEHNLGINNVSFTGGETFLNPYLIQMLELCLKKGYTALVLTNAYRIINRHKDSLAGLNQMYPGKLKIRVSLDHYTKTIHEKERGVGTFAPTLNNIKWLDENGFDWSIAGRSLKAETTSDAIAGYKNTFIQNSIAIPENLHESLIIFPEMDLNAEAPEITTKCWGLLDKKPTDMMCSTDRMIIKTKEKNYTEVVSCTLLPYSEDFLLGTTLKESLKPIYLNHPFCAQFCVLGGASCSGS